MLLLVPGDPMTPHRPDEHFAGGAKAVGPFGHDVAVVDHDALVAGNPDAAVRRVGAAGRAVYRGWMVRPAEYASLAEALAPRDVAFRTHPDAYERAHLLPGWYSLFAELTSRTAVVRGPGLDGFEDALAAVGPGPAVLKDHVKSMKHYWAEAMFLPDAPTAQGLDGSRSDSWNCAVTTWSAVWW